MTQAMKQNIERNHELACALQLIIAFTERPDYLGGAMELDEAMQEIARQGGYHVTVAEMEREWNRVRLTKY
jgi:hypothetical protein